MGSKRIMNYTAHKVECKKCCKCNHAGSLAQQRVRPRQRVVA